SRIQSGSPLTLESSSITSREMPFLATSCPCSSSTIGLGLGTRVLSGVAMGPVARGQVRPAGSDIYLYREGPRSPGRGGELALQCPTPRRRPYPLDRERAGA